MSYVFQLQKDVIKKACEQCRIILHLPQESHLSNVCMTVFNWVENVHLETALCAI